MKTGELTEVATATCGAGRIRTRASLNALEPMTAPTNALTSGRRLALAFFQILSSKIVTMPKKKAAG